MSHWQADIVVAVAVAPVALLPLAVGGVHPEVQLAFAVVELLCALAWIALGAVQRRPLYAPWTALPLAAAVVITAVEVLPLPSSLLALIAPHTVETRSFVVSALPAALQAQVLPVLSMDPPETKAALVRLVGALALTFVVANGARRRERARLIWRMLVAGAALLLVVAVGHAVVGVGAWGMFSRHRGVLFAPMVNGNHMSKVFGAWSLLCLGRALSCRDRRETIACIVVGVGCGIAVALTLSRGGVVAWIAAVVVGIVLLVRARLLDAEDRRPWHHLALPAVVTVAAVCVGALAASDKSLVDEVAGIPTEVQHREHSKLSLWAPALRLLEPQPFVGTGNNAFGVAFTSVSQPGTMYDAEVTYTHVENIVVATLVEHGVLAGGVLLVLAVLVGVRLLQSLRTRVEIAALPALVLLVVGDLVDFSLESGAGISLLATTLGLCAAALPAPRRAPVAVAASTVVALTALVAFHAPAAVAGWRYRNDAVVAAVPRTGLREVLQRTLVSHPFDAVRCAQLATEARYRRQPREALQWANRAINLWPTLPAGHLEAARALVVTGHLEQAMLEYREAARGTPALLRILDEAFDRTADADLRRRAVPDLAAAVAVLCRRFERDDRLNDARRCADELAARDDATPAQRLQPAHLALAAHDIERLRALKPTVLANATVDAEHAVVAGRVIAALDGAPAALAHSDAWVGAATSNTPALLRWRLEQQQSLGLDAAAAQTIAELRGVVRTAAEHDALDRAEAAVHEHAGNLSQLEAVLQRLANRHPDDVNILARLGLVEVQLGHLDVAHRLWERIRSSGKRSTVTKSFATALGVDKAP